MDNFNNAKPAKGTTEKKKRKRPSKKVPTTILEASSNNFMNLVQKLTGSADELTQLGAAAAAPKSTSTSPYPSPYSSPSNHTTPQEDPPQQQSYFQQYLHSTSTVDDDSGSSHHNTYSPAPYASGPSSYPGMGSQMDTQYKSNYDQYENYGSVVGSGSRVRGTGDDQDDQYQGTYGGRYNSNDNSDHVGYHPSSSRAMESDVSPFSWRDPMNHNSTSDYWYHVDAMPAK